MGHRSTDELAAGLDDVRAAPADQGELKLIVRRPSEGEREVLDTAELSVTHGLVGDNWRARGSRHTGDGTAEVDRQLTIMSIRACALFDDDEARWPLAGDQLYVDLDISAANLPPGTRVRLGEAVVEISTKPHTGCAKFAERFGMDAARFVNSPAGAPLRLRGLNASVVTPGTIRTGDPATKL
jgi:MOSC domain-containing protein YiiM